MKCDDHTINQVMQACGGDRKMAALALGTTKETLAARLTGSQFLRTRWVNDGPATPQIPYDVAPPPEEVAKVALQRIEPSDEDLRLVAQMAAEDDRFNRDFSTGLLTVEEMQMATQLQRAHRSNVASCVGLFSGGMATLGVRMLNMAMQLSDQITSGAGEPKERAAAWRNFHRCCDTMVQMAKVSQDGAVLRAKVELWRSQERAKKKARPEFGGAKEHPL